MIVNRPASCGQPSVAALARTSRSSSSRVGQPSGGSGAAACSSSGTDDNGGGGGGGGGGGSGSGSSSSSSSSSSDGDGYRWDANFHANVSSLHTHFNEDGFGPPVPIYYAILSLFDMDERSGCTAVVAGSHHPARVAAITRYRASSTQRCSTRSSPRQSHTARTSCCE